MPKFNPENERTKHRYLRFLTGPKRFSDDSVDQMAAALADFEASTNWKDFHLFRPEQAERYVRVLETATNGKTGRPLAKATIAARLMALKSFFHWLAMEPGFRSNLKYSDAEYFNMSANDGRIAKAVRGRPVPTIEQIRHVVLSMPSDTDIQRRDRALVAFTLLSGARDNAIASLSLKHIDIDKRQVIQDAREVRTKNAKTFTSTFFPVDKEIEAVVVEWIRFLQTERLWGPDDPLFPATRSVIGKNGVFENGGLDRRHWRSASAIRKIFAEAFKLAGLPYFHPHSFRKTLVGLGQRICPTPEAFKAWSQNLAHEKVLTTFTSYGSVGPDRQAEILSQLAARSAADQPPHRQVVTLAPDQVDEIVHRLQTAAGRA